MFAIARLVKTDAGKDARRTARIPAFKVPEIV